MACSYFDTVVVFCMQVSTCFLKFTNATHRDPLPPQASE